MNEKLQFEIGGNNAPLKKTLDESKGLISRFSNDFVTLQSVAAQSLESTGGGMAMMAARVGTVGGAIVGVAATVGAAVITMANNTAKTADQFGKLAERAGMGVESFSKFAYAASLGGAGADDLSRGMTGLSKKMLEAKNGGEESRAVFKALGVQYQQTDGQLRPVEDVLLDVADAFKKMPDGAEKAAIAAKLMEEAGLKLIPTLNAGADAIKRWGEEAKRIGVVFTDEQLAAAKEYELNMKRLRAAASGLGNDIGNAVLPTLAALSTKLLENRGAGLGWWDSFIGTLTGSDNPAKRLQELNAQLSILKAKQQEMAGAGIPADSGLAQKIQATEKAMEFYAEKARAATAKTETEEAESATRRAGLEQKLADKKIELAKLVAYIQTGEGARTEQEQKAQTDRKIADQQRLVEAVRSAWQSTRSEAEKATKAAENKLSKAADIRSQGEATAANIRISELPPEDQLAARQQRLRDLAQEGNYQSAVARNAAIDGDAQKYEKAAVAAEKKLQEALQLAQEVKDATAVEDISKEMARIQEAGAKLDQKAASDLTAKAEGQAQTLNELQTKLEGMQQAARSIEVKLKVDELAAGIADVELQLAKLTAPRQIPVSIVQTAAAGSDLQNMPMLEPYLTPARAFGGPLPGRAPHDRADNQLYWGTPGEWVIQRPAVRHYGPGFIAAVNAMKLPKHAFGGEIGGALSNFPIPTLLPTSKPAANNNSGSTVVLDFGKLGRFQTSASEDVAKEITKVFSHAALQFGRR
ncbi:hypothetical protein [Dechloromonas denitrificans]|uniref:hypothetical protein n=1 Tax=Dechloromonas denitrificans TaxID=281362 RepID=UPI001CF9FB19|nr:hypothetical protein [Dechloromonas denitrificans]UCV09141.1 hypothetical protein KI615_06330 [Dechloromonas denitrificans]